MYILIRTTDNTLLAKNIRKKSDAEETNIRISHLSETDVKHTPAFNRHWARFPPSREERNSYSSRKIPQSSSEGTRGRP